MTPVAVAGDGHGEKNAQKCAGAETRKEVNGYAETPKRFNAWLRQFVYLPLRGRGSAGREPAKD